jgi:hypothetical protein
MRLAVAPRVSLLASTQALATIINTAAETAAHSYTLRRGIPAEAGIRHHLFADVLNNTGVDQTLRAGYRVGASGLQDAVQTLTTAATFRRVLLLVELWVINIQTMNLVHRWLVSNPAGLIWETVAVHRTAVASLSPDLRIDQALEHTIQFGVANAALEFRPRRAIVEQLLL